MKPSAVAAGAGAGREARSIAFVGDDAALVAALQKRQPAAMAAFHDRFAGYVLRVLVRILGQDAELEDLHHEVFVRALGSIGGLEDPARLSTWMVSVAVHTAKGCLQRRYRRRWLSLWTPEALAEAPDAAYEQDWNGQAELRATYRLLDRMPAEERISFTLRYIDGMALTELAEACGVSLATIKRRLKKAESRFYALARQHPLLAQWVEAGGRCR
ncbi:MAG TPA: sigma-70 family RNA polymerase sigma factor [Polyangiaceae bacterium]|nr:sigma-70 family RNA polymerase sigma factor [Polyangiaceae bacterium]